MRNGLDIVPEKLDERVKQIEKWSDAKKFVFEDLVVYGGMVLGGLCLDFVLSGFHRIFNPEHYHPFRYGVLQIGAVVLGMIQFVRAWDRWRYYR